MESDYDTGLMQREQDELMDWLTVGEQISKKIGGPGFGELAGSVQMQFNRCPYLPFYVYN